MIRIERKKERESKREGDRERVTKREIGRVGDQKSNWEPAK